MANRQYSRLPYVYLDPLTKNVVYGGCLDFIFRKQREVKCFYLAREGGLTKLKLEFLLDPTDPTLLGRFPSGHHMHAKFVM